MGTRKLFLVFGFFFLLSSRIVAQDNCIPIAINEYCASDIPSVAAASPDVFGEFSDWVELKCNFTSSVSLALYYLSNDRNNLFKWAFPSSFTIAPGAVKMVRLSGRNTIKNGVEYHTNFTLEQCKNQWIILSTSSGVIRDSVFVMPAKGGHSWGRIKCDVTGIGAFRLYTDGARSPGAQNSLSNYKGGYCPTPKLFVATETNFTGINKGGFYPEAQIGYFKLEGRTYDTASTCYDIFYTVDGSDPIPFYEPTVSLNTTQYIDSLLPIAIAKTQVIRFLSVPRYPATAACPPRNLLPSFIESNTYFIDDSHQKFSEDFGVISVSMNDKNWFLANGSTAASIHVEYYDKKQQLSEGYAQINKPIQESWLTNQKGFYISIDDRFGSGCNFEGNIFNVEGLGTTTRAIFPTLHLKGGDLEAYSPSQTVPDDEVYGTGLRDVFLQSLAAKNDLHVNPLRIKPVIAFFDGLYSGVFDLREVFDKYYESFYNGQPADSLDLNFRHKNYDDYITYWDGAPSTTIYNNWKTEVYDVVMNNPMGGKNNQKYKQVMEKLDKKSFIDYMILQSFSINPDLWNYNIGFGRGHDQTKPGHKWHYFLWNMPAIFNFTIIGNQGQPRIGSPSVSPCDIHKSILGIAPLERAHNGHGNMLTLLMGNYPQRPSWGNEDFKLEYKNRYQDLLNGPLSCENLLKHWDFIEKLYRPEMLCHGDAACEIDGDFHSIKEPWDSNMITLRRALNGRCYSAGLFNTPGCYSMPGPFNVEVDVRPTGAGKVRVNSLLLNDYKWTGKYYQTTMSFKAIPTSDEFAFDHWEFTGPIPKDPLSKDSVGLNLNTSVVAVAVFTDKRNGIIGEGPDANVPTAFSPNGDGYNETFRPLGSAEYATEYQMTIWNRWGQEVFRSVDVYSGWDGNYKGSQAHTGVYAYVITYKNIYNEAKVVKGNVTLTR